MSASAEPPLPRSHEIREGVYDLSAITPTPLRWWKRGFASRIVIDRAGARVEYPGSKSQTLRWDDPTLAFYLVDYRASVARNDKWTTPSQAKRTPFKFFPGPFSSPSLASPVWITMEAYRALYETGFALRLHVSHGGGKDYASDTVVTVFGRKPLALWHVHELNPDAE